VSEPIRFTADTIFALSSAAGRAGVAVVRLSGPHAGAALESVCGTRPEPRRAVLRSISDPLTMTQIDRGLVLWLPGPASFTGEDTAELQVHGGRAVVKALLAALAALPGCRPAEPGEFARRAFVNGRIDLTAAEGLADLIDAETEAQRRQALSQSTGALSKLYEGWRSELVVALGLVEAAIDFSDEGDVSDQAVTEADATASSLLRAISRHLDDGHRGEILRDGFRVVLAGLPNTGKSSLLNALARRDAAIVSEEAGTTRDVIEVRLDLDGLPVIVADTAGLRPDGEAGAVEREGMRRTLAWAQGADLVLWLDDGRPQSATAGLDLGATAATVRTVRTKADLMPRAAADTGGLAISAKTGAGLDELQHMIASAARDAVGSAGDEAPLTQARHRHLLTSAAAALDAYLSSHAGELELRAEDLRRAGDALGRITGRIDVEEVLGAVFGRFCIGK
jgi:tRNA modification GTPase